MWKKPQEIKCSTALDTCDVQRGLPEELGKVLSNKETLSQDFLDVTVGSLGVSEGNRNKSPRSLKTSYSRGSGWNNVPTLSLIGTWMASNVWHSTV